jgi:hypothetical protein
MGKDRPFDSYADAEVIRLPDWGIQWEMSEPLSKRGEPHWWGAIPNKYESVRWLAQSGRIRDEDTLLFLDPDMIFTEAIDEKPADGEIIAQRFIHYYAMPPWSNDAPGEGIMYPFILNGKTLRSIVDDYKIGCEEIRRQTHRWEAEMWGLDYAVKKNGLKISYREKLGFCTAWRPNGDTEISSLIHFPNEILNTRNERIWFKQDYTFRSDMQILVNEARNELDKKLLLNVVQERTDYLYYNKWDFSDIFKSYDGSEGYAILKPYPGGFNNIRMSLELAVCIAYLTNKTLVLPPKYNMYLLQDQMGMEDFFDTEDLGIKTMSLHEFSLIKDIRPIFEDVEKISTVWDEPPERVINFAKIHPTDAFLKGRQSVVFPSKESECILLKGTLLGAWYQTIHSSKDEQLKKLVARHVHYRKELFDLGFEGVNWLGDKNYYAIHIRRNDFQYKHLFISAEDLLNNIKDQVPQSARLYIATDCQDKSYFAPLQKYYNVFFYEDVVTGAGIKCPHYNFIPIIEQLICSRAVAFIGNDYSTLSSYIYRMRGYMADIEDKKFRINTMPYSEEEQWNFLNCRRYIGNWAREFSESWGFQPKKIFVSLASYRDKQLIPTIKDLLSRAQDPSRVYIGVHLQNDNDSLNELISCQFPNTRIIHTLPEDSLGVVWARERIKNELYSNEDYFLQVDSHSRFKDNWDGILIRQHQSLPSSKAVISTYPNEFRVEDENETYFNIATNAPLYVKEFNDDRSNLVKPANRGALNDFDTVNSMWIAGGFIFAPKEWVNQIKSPTNIKCKGEEDYLFFASYLNGWDILLPSEATVWHSYQGHYRSPNYNAVPDSSELVIDQLLLDSSPRVRSISDLESYIGVKFRLKPPTIFVALTSFIDPDLRNTILSCVQQAKHPENLSFGLILQYNNLPGSDERCVDDLITRYNIRVRKYWYENSLGGCWARKEVSELLNDEQYILQVDCHTRFAKNWDETLIKDLRSTRTKSLISYLSPPFYRNKELGVDYFFKYVEDPYIVNVPKMTEITEDYWPKFVGYTNEHHTQGKIRAVSILYAGFVFAPASWYRDVQNDPDHYYTGEEFALSIRSFTHGYDIYQPSKIVSWHKSDPDHVHHFKALPTGDELHRKAMVRLRALIEGGDLGRYGLGTSRSLSDYESFARIDIKQRKIYD